MSGSAFNLKGFQECFRKQLDKEDNVVTKAIGCVSVKTKVAKEHVAYSAIAFMVLYLIFGWGSEFICNLIGFAYPAYASIKAIETPLKDDDTKWLMYWCAYALFGILEVFSDYLLFWIPFYTLFKCVFLLWLMVPGKNGGTYMIYNRVLKPFVLKHGSTIDSAASKIADAAKSQ
jgi:receptor expression-enhancing protein 5/6